MTAHIHDTCEHIIGTNCDIAFDLEDLLRHDVHGLFRGFIAR